MKKFDILKKKVLEKSINTNWMDAKQEWRMVLHEINEEYLGECTCTQHDLYHLYTIKNINNKQTLVVGSRCIKHFKNPIMTEKVKIVEKWGTRILKYGKYKGMSYQDAIQDKGFPSYYAWATGTATFHFKKNLEDVFRYYSVVRQLHTQCP